MPTLTQTATTPITGMFADLDEEFDDTIALFVADTELQADRLVALRNK